jgi:hypothetical protein
VSSDITDGYFSIRGGDGQNVSPVINEIKLIGPSTAPDEVQYRQYTFDFNSGNFSQLLFYVGMFGNGRDAWLQIDDVGVSCQTPF